MDKDSKIIHVELKEPFLGKKNYYFGSIVALFAVLPEDIIGVKATTIQRHLHKAEEYKAPGATIRRSTITRSQHRRK